MVYTYLVTIRKSQVKDYVSYNDLKSRIARLRGILPRLSIIIRGYEAHGLYNQLHVHFLLYHPTRINYKSINALLKGDGFIYHFKQCVVSSREDMERICNYITKYDWNMYSRDMILCENYYRYHYGF